MWVTRTPLFTQEREDAASRRQAYHFLDEGLLSSQSSSVGHVRTGRLVSNEFGSLMRPLKSFIHESSSDSRPSNLHDLEIDDCTIGRALSSPLFTQEREDQATRKTILSLS